MNFPLLLVDSLYLKLKILIFIVLILPFEDTAWRKELYKWLLYLRTQGLLCICFLLQQFCSKPKLIFLPVTLTSLVFEHVFLAPLASWVPLLWTPFQLCQTGENFVVTVATVLKDGIVAYPVTVLQYFWKGRETFGKHDIYQNFRLASQYAKFSVDSEMLI